MVNMVWARPEHGGDTEKKTETVRCRDGTAQCPGWDRSAGGEGAVPLWEPIGLPFAAWLHMGNEADPGVIDRDAVRIRHGSSVPCQSVGTAAARMMAFVFGRL